jgi:hypothetical protein
MTLIDKLYESIEYRSKVEPYSIPAWCPFCRANLRDDGKCDCENWRKAHDTDRAD